MNDRDTLIENEEGEKKNTNEATLEFTSRSVVLVHIVHTRAILFPSKVYIQGSNRY